MSLPFVNRGVFRLDDLPQTHRKEIVRLMKSTRALDVVGRLQAAASEPKRSMFFFKWYGVDIAQSADIPAFHQDYEYIVTIGVSVFNKRQSVSRHFGPLRATYRVLYNINDMPDNSAYIVVGKTRHFWKQDKLFIFDDTLFHQSINESDALRYCLFVDILRPTMLVEEVPGLRATWVAPPGGYVAVQQLVPIVFPEYTAVNVLAPVASCDALSGILTAVVVAPVGSSVCVDSKVDPSMKFTVPLGAPPPPGLAETVAVRVVD